jgi:hypothetical protein
MCTSISVKMPLEEVFYVDDLVHGELWQRTGGRADFPLLDHLAVIDDENLLEFDGRMIEQLLGELEAFRQAYAGNVLIHESVAQWMSVCRLCLEKDFRLVFGGDSI